MSLLAPLFLLGAAAIALPIVFHLIRRTTKDRVPFSSLMFLSATPPRVTRRSRLENLWLLLLRCLVLGLLALGFARPFLQKARPNDQAGGARQRTAILIDISASMRREALWAQATAQAAKSLRTLPVSDEVSLFVFDHQLRPIVTFDQWSAEKPDARIEMALTRLRNVQPSWGATHLGPAIIGATEALEDAAGRGATSKSAAGGKMIVISDFAQGAQLTGLQGFEWPVNFEIVLEPVKAARAANAGLQPVAEPASGGGSDLTAVRVRVSNSAESTTERYKVGWSNPQGALRPETAIDAYVPPGESRVYKLPVPGTGSNGRRSVLTGDSFDFDNNAYWVVAQPDPLTIVYLGKEPVTDSAQPFYYLDRAFQKTGQQSIQVVAHPVDREIAAGGLEDAALLVVGDVLSPALQRQIRESLLKGKTALAVVKNESISETLAQLAGVGAVRIQEAAPRQYSMLGQIDFQHPLFAPFADPRYSDFTKIHFWKYRSLNVADFPSARVPAQFDSGDPAVLEVPVGEGWLLILASSWHPADSQLALSSKFVPLLYSMLEKSGAVLSQQFQFTIGDPIPLRPDKRSTTVVITKPDSTSITLTNNTIFQGTDLPGIYRVSSGTRTQEFALNLASEETRTAPMDLAEFGTLGLPLSAKSLLTQREEARKAEQLRAAELENRQKLWRWLILVALVLLLLETWAGGWLTRRAIA